MASGVYLHYLNSTYIAKIYTQTNFIIRQFLYGGAGGNRTPVRKPSTGSSTYLAMLFIFNFYFTNKQANVKASYLKFKRLLSNPIIPESLFMTL